MNFNKNLIVFCLLLFSSGLSYAACGDISQQAMLAMEGSDLKKLEKIHEEGKKLGCSAQMLCWLERQIAVFYLQRANQHEAAGWIDQCEADVKSALFYDRHYWMALANMGDILIGKKDYAMASLYFQQALDAIADERSTPEAPTPAIIGKIFKRAETSRLLAKTFVETPTSRSGAPGGLSAISWRGFVPEKVAVPITFVTQSTLFTKTGKKTAQNMLEDLKTQGSPDITLIGHADERGPEKDNFTLSMNRAKQVRYFMKKKGYTGEIKVNARGENEPYKLEDRYRYSTQEYYQMCRRVELLRK